MQRQVRIDSNESYPGRNRRSRKVFTQHGDRCRVDHPVANSQRITSRSDAQNPCVGGRSGSRPAGVCRDLEAAINGCQQVVGFVTERGGGRLVAKLIQK